MFKDIQFADWAGWIAIIAFAVSFSVFLFFLIGAIRMPRKKVKHDSELPLTEENRS